jgi:hypothetical protein
LASLVLASCASPSATSTVGISATSAEELLDYFDKVQPIVDKHQQMITDTNKSHSETLALIKEPIAMRSLSDMSPEEMARALRVSHAPDAAIAILNKAQNQLISNAADFQMFTPPSEASEYYYLITKSFLQDNAAFDSWIYFWQNLKQTKKQDDTTLQQANTHFQNACDLRSQALSEMDNIVRKLK